MSSTLARASTRSRRERAAMVVEVGLRRSLASRSPSGGTKRQQKPMRAAGGGVIGRERAGAALVPRRPLRGSGVSGGLAAQGFEPAALAAVQGAGALGFVRAKRRGGRGFVRA